MALAGQKVSGTEGGDELGLALRGYAPVMREGVVVGAVMIADPIDDQLLERLTGSGTTATQASVEPEPIDAKEDCDTSSSVAATCRFSLISPAGLPVATLTLQVPLSEIENARADAQRTLWIIGGIVLAISALVAWILASSLTRPLARLTASADQISRGEYSETTKGPSGRDEIGKLARAFDTMRERVAEATGALRKERDVLDAVLESAGDGILMTDPKGNRVISNARWTELLGSDGLSTAPSLRRIDSENGTLADFAHASLAAGPEWEEIGEFERIDPYGRFNSYTAPVRDPENHDYADGNSVIGRIFVLRDVTRESEAERMRSALISSVSHELRSPLTAIKGYTDTMLDGGPWDDDSEREFLEIVRQSADKLSILVENLLDAAKAEAKTWSLDPEPVRVERIAQQVVTQRSLLSPDHALECVVEPDLPLVNADPMRVEQIITNLIDNAIKYSPGGGPVNVRVADGDALVVSVSDTGIGITSEDAEHLFERFYRVDSDQVRRAKGVGLGLFICKSLVEAQGGHIWVESRPDGGSTFSFTLPKLKEVEIEANTLHRVG